MSTVLDRTKVTVIYSSIFYLFWGWSMSTTETVMSLRVTWEVPWAILNPRIDFHGSGSWEWAMKQREPFKEALSPGNPSRTWAMDQLSYSTLGQICYTLGPVMWSLDVSSWWDLLIFIRSTCQTFIFAILWLYHYLLLLRDIKLVSDSYI